MRKGSTVTCPKSVLCFEKRCAYLFNRFPRESISSVVQRFSSKSKYIARKCAGILLHNRENATRWSGFKADNTASGGLSSGISVLPSTFPTTGMSFGMIAVSSNAHGTNRSPPTPKRIPFCTKKSTSCTR